MSLYCRMSSVLDLDALITQQALREAITDTEVATAKQRHQHILDYTQVGRCVLICITGIVYLNLVSEHFILFCTPFNMICFICGCPSSISYYML